MNRIIFLLTFFTFSSISLAADLSYKKRDNEGESKYERIGKIEVYLSKLSSQLAAMHKKLEKDFDLKMEELQSKVFKVLDTKLKPLEKEGLIPNYALSKDLEELKSKMGEQDNLISDLQSQIKKLERELKRN